MKKEKIFSRTPSYLVLIISSFISELALAQNLPKDTTMNRTVIVEQQYNPEIESATKINILPKISEPIITKRDVKYDEKALPAKAIPFSPMTIYMSKEEQNKVNQGYARLGYGNYNNLDAKINYLFILSKKDKLNFSGSMNGMNSELTTPEIREIGQSKKKWDSRFYRSQTEISYLHQFNKIDLDISGQAQQESFNYANNLMNDKTTDKQKYTSGNVHFGIKSTEEALPFQFKAETNLLFFNKKYSISGKTAQERIFRTKAIVTGNIDDQQKVTVAAQMDNLSYSSQFKDYTSLLLNSYYELKSDDWYLKAGAHFDLAFNYGKSVRISPDLVINYIFSDSYILYAEAKGGKTINSFMRMEEVHPYSDSEVRVADSYTQLNTTLGFKASPMTGFWFNLYGGYKIVADDFAPIYISTQKKISFLQGKSKNLFTGANISYQYKGLYEISASTNMYTWKNTNKSLLIQKPSLELSLNLNAQIMPKLEMNLGYQYIHYSNSEIIDPSPTAYSSETASYRMPSVNNIRMGLIYQLFPHVTIYTKIENLLNKKYQYYYAYPTEGINFLGGLNFNF